jgi:hypothetical protein
MMRSVRPMSSRPKMALNGFSRRTGFARSRVHAGDSCTLRRIQIVNSAGTTPTTNSQRHPSSPNDGLLMINVASTAAAM